MWGEQHIALKIVYSVISKLQHDQHFDTVIIIQPVTQSPIKLHSCSLLGLIFLALDYYLRDGLFLKYSFLYALLLIEHLVIHIYNTYFPLAAEFLHFPHDSEKCFSGRKKIVG